MKSFGKSSVYLKAMERFCFLSGVRSLACEYLTIYSYIQTATDIYHQTEKILFGVLTISIR